MVMGEATSVVGRLDPQPWMALPGTRRVLDSLTLDGAEARFVGGCVRDAVLARAVTDIDIATPLPPHEVLARLRSADIKAVPTGFEHGTITAVSNGRPYEITTLRRDVETDGRHAKVAFTDDWREDAARRDFTINALSCRSDGTLFDYFGGRADLQQGIVRFVGDPDARIAEDVLRLLRFYRFFAHYGRGQPDPAARAACQRMAHRLPSLSAERLREETVKLLRAPAPHAVLSMMRVDGVLGAYLPEATAFERLGRLVDIEQRLGRALQPDALLRLAGVTEDGADIGGMADRLRFSKRERLRLVALHRAGPRVPFDAAGLRRLFYRVGTDLVCDQVMLTEATKPNPHIAAVRSVLRAGAAWVPVHLPVNGEDVKALGIEHGEAIGSVLNAVEAWWIERDFRPDRVETLAQLREIVRADREETPTAG
jgi:poly(A) polymerase